MQLTLPLCVSLYYFWPFLVSQCIALCFGDNNAHLKKVLLLVFTFNFSGDVNRLKLTEKRLRYHCRSFGRWPSPRNRFSVFFFCCPTRREMRNRGISQSLSLMNVVYLPVSKYAISVYKCTTLNGPSVLTAFPNMPCGSSEHSVVFAIGCLATTVYTVSRA
jgi:hypothetical protein